MLLVGADEHLDLAMTSGDQSPVRRLDDLEVNEEVVGTQGSLVCGFLTMPTSGAGRSLLGLSVSRQNHPTPSWVTASG